MTRNDIVENRQVIWNSYAEDNDLEEVTLEQYLWNQRSEGEVVEESLNDFFDYATRKQESLKVFDF